MLWIMFISSENYIRNRAKRKERDNKEQIGSNGKSLKAYQYTGKLK